MKHSIKTKVAALLLTLTLCLGSVAITPNSAQAVSNYDIFLNESATATPEETATYAFTLNKRDYTYIDILVAQPVAFTCTVKSASGILFDKDITVNDSNWVYSDALKAYDYPLSGTINNGDYTISLTFHADVNYIISAAQKKTSFSINNKSIIVTKGFSQKLSTVNASGKVKWSSSNKKVAVVDKNGKVTGKKAGSATITATLSNGSKATCKVSVKNNEFKAPKLTISEANFGNAYISIYKAAYSKKGDLTISASFLNNRGYKMTRINTLKITVKNKAGKTIGTYKLAGKKKVSILHGGQKSYTFTIKKSQLKLKSKQDLRIATFKPNWTYTYTYSH